MRAQATLHERNDPGTREPVARGVTDNLERALAGDGVSRVAQVDTRWAV